MDPLRNELLKCNALHKEADNIIQLWKDNNFVSVKVEEAKQVQHDYKLLLANIREESLRMENMSNRSVEVQDQYRKFELQRLKTVELINALNEQISRLLSHYNNSISMEECLLQCPVPIVTPVPDPVECPIVEVKECPIVECPDLQCPVLD